MEERIKELNFMYYQSEDGTHGIRGVEKRIWCTGVGLNKLCYNFSHEMYFLVKGNHLGELNQFYENIKALTDMPVNILVKFKIPDPFIKEDFAKEVKENIEKHIEQYVEE